MEGLDKITRFLSDKDITFINEAERMYKQNARIFFRVHEYNGKKNAITVKVWQTRNLAGKYLSLEELRDRVKGLFSTIPDDIAIHVHAKPFLAYGIKDVDLSWIKEQMTKHKINQAELSDYLNIHKSIISEWIAGNKDLTEVHKTMFFYFFKCLD